MSLRKGIVHKLVQEFAFTYPCPRKLREVVKLTLLEREPKDKIAEIWHQYHIRKSENIATHLNKEEYETIKKQAKQSPLFILPVKRKSGHFILLGQSQEKSFLFTFLEDYKKHGANAQPYFIMTLFDEFLFTKGVVLARGDIVNYQIDKVEAASLWEHTVRMYFTPELYQDFINVFNHDPERFDYEKFKKYFDIC